MFPKHPAECKAKMCPHQEFLGKESKRKRAWSKKRHQNWGWSTSGSLFREAQQPASPTPQTHTFSSLQQRKKLNTRACPQIPCFCSIFTAEHHPAASSMWGKGLTRHKLTAQEQCWDQTFAFSFSPSFCPCFAWRGCSAALCFPSPWNPAAGAQQDQLSYRKPAACGVFLGHSPC